MMTESVWMLEIGEYSDYRVVGVFSSRMNAETMQEVTGGSIREAPLNPGVQETNAGLKMHEVWMHKNGNTSRSSRFYSGALDCLEENLWVRMRDTEEEYLVAHVYAKDATHAVKITNEKRIQMIANGEW